MFFQTLSISHILGPEKLNPISMASFLFVPDIMTYKIIGKKNWLPWCLNVLTNPPRKDKIQGELPIEIWLVEGLPGKWRLFDHRCLAFHPPYTSYMTKSTFSDHSSFTVFGWSLLVSSFQITSSCSNLDTKTPSQDAIVANEGFFSWPPIPKT